MHFGFVAVIDVSGLLYGLLSHTHSHEHGINKISYCEQTQKRRHSKRFLCPVAFYEGFIFIQFAG